MFKDETTVSGSEEDQCEFFKENSKQTKTANQSILASALHTLLDISTNAHLVMDTSDVPTVSVKGCYRNITIK